MEGYLYFQPTDDIAGWTANGCLLGVLSVGSSLGDRLRLACARHATRCRTFVPRPGPLRVETVRAEERGGTIVTADPQFAELMARLRGGDEEVARLVYERFAARLAQVARARLAHPLRAKLDADDIVQSVFRSFFGRQRQGQWRLEDWSELEGLLAAITLHKCGKQAARYGTQQRNTAREVPLSAAEQLPATQQLRCEPSPEEVATLSDLLARLMESLESQDAEVLLLRLEGYTAAEIGRRMGRAVRTVWRALKRCQARLEALEAEALAELE